ncbi:MAG: acyl-CoA reductase [Candidatus Baltobacteraceae bacterium]
MLELPVAQIIGGIADAAQRWSDADFPPRVRVTDAIVQRTGYSTPVVEYALDRLFFELTSDALKDTIAAELGSLAALDGFVGHRGKPDRFARGLDRVCIISSRTTIGVALLPALFALCAKCDVTVKDREDHFITAFFETLRDEHEAFAASARASAWKGAQDAFDLRPFDAVVAFGKDTTLAQIRASCSPDARFLGFGNRASAGYVTRDAVGDAAQIAEIAAGAARDLLLYESEGCLSLHVLFVEADDCALTERFLRLLTSAVQKATIEFPLGLRDAADASRVAHLRAAAAFRAASGQGGVYSDDACSFLLVYDPRKDDPPAFAPRTLGIVPVHEPAEAIRYLRQHDIRLEAFALSDERPDLIKAAISSGAVRLAPFGELQRLPVGADHGGRPRIADFIRWIDREI